MLDIFLRPYTMSVELGALDICLRFLCAMLVGLVIGTEREYTHRPAGMRTHILVALGACGVMITGQAIFAQYSALGASPDPARMAAQVITGVGLLGAGTIMREGANVKGLTTAASLWSVACLGIAAGAGYYIIALVGMVFIFITLTLFEILQDKLIGKHIEECNYILETDDIDSALEAINDFAKDNRMDIRQVLAKTKNEGLHSITFKADVSGLRANKRREKFFSGLATHRAIKSITQAKPEIEE